MQIKIWKQILEDQKLGTSVSAVAECFGRPVGYINLYIDSPDSSFYQACKDTVEKNLDRIIDTLLDTREFSFPSAEELDAFEKGSPHSDGKRWCVAEQTIGNYYWNSHFIIRLMIDILWHI